MRAAARRSRRQRRRCGLAVAAAGCTAGPIEIATLPTDTASPTVWWRTGRSTRTLGYVANDSSGNGRTGSLAGPGWSWIPGQVRRRAALLRRRLRDRRRGFRARPRATASRPGLLHPADYELGRADRRTCSEHRDARRAAGRCTSRCSAGRGTASYVFRLREPRAAQGYALASCACCRRRTSGCTSPRWSTRATRR